MVCVHTYADHLCPRSLIYNDGDSKLITHSESDNALLRYGHLKFSKTAAGRHLEFDPTGNFAVRSAVPENPTLEPNMKEIG